MRLWGTGADHCRRTGEPVGGQGWFLLCRLSFGACIGVVLPKHVTSATSGLGGPAASAGMAGRDWPGGCKAACDSPVSPIGLSVSAPIGLPFSGCLRANARKRAKPDLSAARKTRPSPGMVALRKPTVPRGRAKSGRCQGSDLPARLPPSRLVRTKSGSHVSAARLPGCEPPWSR